MVRWRVLPAVLALAGTLFVTHGSLQAQERALPTNVRLMAPQLSMPEAQQYASSSYYQQATSQGRYGLAPMPTDDSMPYQSQVSDEVPPAPPTAAPAAAAPAPAAPELTALYEPSFTTEEAGPWKLFDHPGLAERGINMGGWLEQGLTFNADNPADRFNGPVATNDRDGEYQMNQLWLFMDKATGTHGSCWTWGGRVDMMYGTDFRYGVSNGLETRIDNLDSYYGLVVPQAYGAVGNDRWTIIAGHYAGILNYEQIPAPANFFYSHSYAMGYAVPLLVTGVQTTYKFDSNWSATGGFNRGWMQWEDNNESLDFMGGVAWVGDNKRDRLAFNVDSGAQDDAGDNNRFVYSLIYQHDFTCRFTYALEHVLGHEQNGDVRNGNDAEWYGLTQYLYYTLSPTWKAGLRAEWFRDDDGARVAGVGHQSIGHGWAGGPGFAGDFFEISAGLNWQPTANLLVRPELRWDWYSGTPDLAGELPFDDGTSDKQFLLGTDVILTF